MVCDVVPRVNALGEAETVVFIGIWTRPLLYELRLLFHLLFSDLLDPLLPRIPLPHIQLRPLLFCRLPFAPQYPPGSLGADFELVRQDGGGKGLRVVGMKHTQSVHRVPRKLPRRRPTFRERFFQRLAMSYPLFRCRLIVHLRAETCSSALFRSFGRRCVLGLNERLRARTRRSPLAAGEARYCGIERDERLRCGGPRGARPRDRG